jgi:subtilisin family serine protease
MNDEERYKITSEAYADLLIEYNNDRNIFKNYPSSSVNIVDDNYAVVHFPVINMTPDSIYKYGYANIPSCFGLLSAFAHDSSGITRIRNMPDVKLDGKGVLIGIVDTGIDYTNYIFKNSDNTSRIISLWDQTIDSAYYPKDFYYGTEYHQELINTALKSESPLSIVPSMDENGHGTMMAGIAAGKTIPELNFKGVVPNAELVIVKLKPAKKYLKDFYSIPDEALCYQSNDILLGVRYLCQVAHRLDRPIAICLGVGSNQGGHGGRSILSKYLSDLCTSIGTAIVLSAGNEGNKGHHYYGYKESTIGYDTVELHVGKEKGFSMEFWGMSPNRFWIDVFAPTGEFVTRIPPKVTRSIQVSIEDTAIVIDSEVKLARVSEQCVIFRFFNPMEGIWKLIVYQDNGTLPLNFHLWLPMTNFISPGTFFTKSDNNTTITSPANSNKPICITAYNYVNQSLFYHASRGNTSLNFPKPDLAAPGVNILSPTIHNEFIHVTGTSVAAAHAAGVAAMLLEWGVIHGKLTSMNSLMVKKLLVQGAKRLADLEYPNTDWGYGIIDIYKTYQLIVSDETRISETYNV